MSPESKSKICVATLCMRWTVVQWLCCRIVTLRWSDFRACKVLYLLSKFHNLREHESCSKCSVWFEKCMGGNLKMSLLVSKGKADSLWRYKVLIWPEKYAQHIRPKGAIWGWWIISRFFFLVCRAKWGSVTGVRSMLQAGHLPTVWQQE